MAGAQEILKRLKYAHTERWRTYQNFISWTGMFLHYYRIHEIKGVRPMQADKNI